MGGAWGRVRQESGGQGSHQALQVSLGGVEPPGTRATHTLLVVQVSDGEVESKQHQGRTSGCSGGGSETPVSLSVGHPTFVSSRTGEGLPPRWAISIGRRSQTLALSEGLWG